MYRSIAIHLDKRDTSFVTWTNDMTTTFKCVLSKEYVTTKFSDCGIKDNFVFFYGKINVKNLILSEMWPKQYIMTIFITNDFEFKPIK